MTKPKPTTSDQLEEAKSWFDRGLITSREFSSKKAKILDIDSQDDSQKRSRTLPDDDCSPSQSSNRQKVARTFAVGRVCKKNEAYWVSLATSELIDSLQRGEISLLQGGRQTGKTSMALEACSSLEDTLIIELRSLKGSTDLWKFIHEELAEFNAARFPMPKEPSAATFRAAFQKGAMRVGIFFDEADHLTKLPLRLQSEFLLELWACKQMPRGTLGGICLIGTWDLKEIIQRRSWDSSNPESPFTVVQDIETCVFSLSDIKKLLSQWLADEKGISLRPNMTVFASRILSASGGHIGLTGLLCDRLARLARECISSLQLKNFDNLIKKSMSEAV